MIYPSNCRRCGKVIPLVWPDSPNLDNGLTLQLSGAYGEFIDLIDGVLEVLLCHECAHELADWLHFDPRNWHTHREGSGQHADHHDR